MKTITCTLVILILFCFNAFSQKQEELSFFSSKKVLNKAEGNFENNNYLDALSQFKQLLNYDPDNSYYKLMSGICYSYDPYQKNKSISLIKEVKNESPENNLINFYLGNAYAVNYKFDKAIFYLNLFLNKGQEDAEDIYSAKKVINNCNNAKAILADTIKENRIENIGFPINSQYSEYVPVISADESVMIFTYRGIKSTGAIDKGSESSTSYDEDVVISCKKDGEWTIPVSIGSSINTNEHDAAVALTVDAQTLFVYKGDGGGDLYISQLEGKEWSIPKKITGDVNRANSWEGSCSLSANGKTLYFSSDREGGFGGRDLYKATLQEDKSWGDVENLGMNINTVFNDDAPFIHPNNKTLYFSSQGHTSIGGYDVFSSKKNEDGKFMFPNNLGYPINTIDDNRYFVLAADGKTGYYSAGGRGSLGDQDIYKISLLDKSKEEPLALLSGKVFLNDIPVGAELNLFRKSDGSLEGVFTSNESSGKYVLCLEPDDYNLVIELETGQILKDVVQIDELLEYEEFQKDFRIYDKDLMSYTNLNDSSKIVASNNNDTLFVGGLKISEGLYKLKKDKKIVLNNIYFDVDKSVLNELSITELEYLISILMEDKNINVEVSAHTDSRGSVDKNIDLSKKRAHSVVEFLIKRGISPNRLSSKGYGESQPIATNINKLGRGKNRRVEVKLR